MHFIDRQQSSNDYPFIQLYKYTAYLPWMLNYCELVKTINLNHSTHLEVCDHKDFL